MGQFNEINLTLPFPPSINQYLSNVGNRRFLSKKSRAYQEEIIYLIRQQTGTMPAISDDVAVQIYYIKPDRRKRDVDNFHKCVIDAITKADIWNDDSQIQSLYLEFIKNEKLKPGAYVKINPYKSYFS